MHKVQELKTRAASEERVKIQPKPLATGSLTAAEKKREVVRVTKQVLRDNYAVFEALKNR